MKWFGWGGFAVTVLVLALGASSSTAAPAVRVEVDRHVVRSGQQLDVTARAESECAWSIAWKDQRATGRGRSLAATFTAPRVARPTRIPVVARCFAPAPGSPDRPAAGASPQQLGQSQRITVGVPAGQTATVGVTVLPAGGTVLPPESGLPGTGGPERWIVVAGLGLLLAGSWLRLYARSRPRRPVPGVR